MIFFDTTKTGRPGRLSGLGRVSGRLRQSLGAEVQEVVWDEGLRDLAKWNVVPLGAEDWFVTSELFSEEERPGFTSFIKSRRCRLAAIFHDAIPLKHPHITWPKSVARHPSYMKLLAGFDHVWAVSRASRAELLGFWKWQGIEQTPPVEVLALGADFNAAPRVTARPQILTSGAQRSTGGARLLCLGILEPRKNQSFLLEVCNDLWTEGLAFELHLAGRVNPHFGTPIVTHIKKLRRAHPNQLFHHATASDATVTQLYATAHATVFPTIAEGCGLPLLESLWMATPCICSDLPVLRENADQGGCLPVKVNDHLAWKTAIRRVLTDPEFHQTLGAEATSRPLPTWRDAAHVLSATLR
jgi:glycosyltransferase involved in cell wall biosynthesis